MVRCLFRRHRLGHSRECGVGVEAQLARMSNITWACVGELTWHDANVPSTQLCQTMVYGLMYWDSYNVYVLSVKLSASSTTLGCDISSALALATPERFEICNLLPRLDPP